MVRCPRCKTVLAVETPAESAPPPPPRPVLPLPFDRPAGPVEPVAARPPVAAPAAPIPRATVRGKLVREDDDDNDLLREEREKERRRRRDDEDELARVLAPLERVCRPARTGTTLMAYGALANCLAAVCYFFYGVSTLFTPGGFVPILGLAAVLLGLHWLLTVGGFGFSIAGPKPMRPMAIAGVLVMILHAGIFVPLAMTLAYLISLDELGLSGQGVREPLASALLLSNLFNNLATVTDLPIYLLAGGDLVRPVLLLLPLAGGALEFAKLSLIGILTNHYAVEGKDPELGHLALRFVYRIFWMVIAVVVLKLGLWLGVKITGGEPLLMVWFAIPVWMLTNAYFLWWAFAWSALYTTLLDVTEIITAQRYADKRDRLETL